jgi:hypothetical protein
LNEFVPKRKGIYQNIQNRLNLEEILDYLIAFEIKLLLEEKEHKRHHWKDVQLKMFHHEQKFLVTSYKFLESYLEKEGFDCLKKKREKQSKSFIFDKSNKLNLKENFWIFQIKE